MPADSGDAARRVMDDAALLEGIRRGDPRAIGVFFDRYRSYVERLLARVLGTRDDVGDVLQEVFARVFRLAGNVREPEAVRGWLTTVTIFTARRTLRRRVAMRWLMFLAPGELPEVPAGPLPADDDVFETLRCTYQVLEQIRVDDRIPFALRMLEDMDIKDIARACNVSQATVKRRIHRAEIRFLQLARAHPLLATWVAAGARWGGADGHGDGHG